MSSTRGSKPGKGGKRSGGGRRVTPPGGGSRATLDSNASDWNRLSFPNRSGPRLAASGSSQVTLFMELAPSGRRSDDVGLLAETVESVRAQTMGGLEIVVHDSGYDPARSELVARWAQGDRRVTVRSAAPVAGLAQGAAVLATTGSAPDLLWLRDGDVLPPHALSQSVAHLRSSPTAVASTGRRDLLYPTGAPGAARASETALANTDSVLVGSEVAAAIVSRTLNLLGGSSSVLLSRPVLVDIVADGVLPSQWTATVTEARFLPLWIEVLDRGDLAYLSSTVCRERIDHYWTGDLPRQTMDAALTWALTVSRALDGGAVPAGPRARLGLLGTLTACANLLRQHPREPYGANLLAAMADLAGRLETTSTGAGRSTGVAAAGETVGTAVAADRRGRAAGNSGGTESTGYELSVVVSFCNEIDGLVRCLAALSDASDGHHYEVVLIDDASTDAGVDELLATLGGDLQIVRHQAHLGPAACWNEGLVLAGSELVVLLEPTAEVGAGWLAALIGSLADHPEASVVGLPLVGPSGVAIAAGLDLQRVRLTDGVLSLWPQPLPSPLGLALVDALPAGCVGVQRSAVAALFDADSGPFEPDRLDGDPMVAFCLRVRAAGMSVVVAPGPTVRLHDERRFSTNYRVARWRADALRATWTPWIDLVPASGEPHPADVRPAPPAPLVSIFVPTYRRDELLERAIESARAQTVTDLEILVWDNGSDESTLEVLNQAVKADDRVVWARSPRNLGPVANGDRLLAWTSGTYSKALADDDLLEPLFLETLLGMMADDPGVRLAFARRLYVDTSGARLPEGLQGRPVAATDAVFDGRRFGSLMMRHCDDLVGGLSTSLWRRRDIDALGGFGRIGGRVSNCQSDAATWLALMADGRVAYAGDPLCLMTHHRDQTQRGVDHQIDGLHEWFELLAAGPRLGFLTRPLERADAGLQFASSVAAIDGDLARAELEGGPPRSLASLWQLVGQLLADLPALNAMGR